LVKGLIKYTIVWISQNLAVPFWVVGHVHLSLNIYDDAIEVISSIGMNIIVFVGFIIDYKKWEK
jgi:spore cortex formation protein SpoVR/YcgB (stage V sporulation)